MSATPRKRSSMTAGSTQPIPEPAFALLVAEYQSVREEWLQSRSAQNQTLQWTFAAITLLVTGILASRARTEQPFLYVLLAGLLGAAAIASQAIWFGELTRMERAALYLRGREAHLKLHGPEIYGLPPILWESFRANLPHHQASPWIPKSVSQVVAGFALYGGAAFASTTMLLDSIVTLQRFQPLAIMFSVIVGAGYLTVTAYLGGIALKVLRMSSRRAELSVVSFDSV